MSKQEFRFEQKSPDDVELEVWFHHPIEGGYLIATLHLSPEMVKELVEAGQEFLGEGDE